LIDYKEQLSNYIIEESPVKRSADPLSSTQEVSTTQFIKPKVPVSDHKFSAPSNQKLPGPGGRKQRPTSYHPGLYTGSSFATSQQDITHAAASDPKFSRPFSRSESINSIASLNNSKNISLPSVDLASAEGAIITPRSPSVIPPGVIGPSERSESGAVKIGNNLETGEKLEEVQELPRDITLDSNSSQKKTNRYSAIMTAELVFDKIFGSSSADQVPTLDVNDKSKESTGNKKSKESISKMDSETTSVHSNIASNISTTTTRNTSYQCSSMEQRRTKSSNNNNKTKRFSFLSFYNGNSSQSDDIQMNIPKVSKKKVLEPSKDINIAIKERKPTAGNNRDSVITYTSFAPKKEPSTAKKVMDFFKRRSMRVG
jgi:protein-serine/threonine kinase